MSAIEQSGKRQLLPFISEHSGKLEEYDRKKLKEYIKLADERSNFTQYELTHIDRMYEKVMKAITGMGVDVKKEPKRGGLRYG